MPLFNLGGKRPEVTGNVEKNGDGEISARLNEDVPTSAVALKMKEKVCTTFISSFFMVNCDIFFGV